MTHNQLAKNLLNDPAFRSRMDCNEALGVMRRIFIGIAHIDDPRIGEYLEAHDRVLEILSGLTGEIKE